jgi:putative glycosyltransferase (TIGR04348 family)
MKILIVSPAPPGIETGNAVTARRWARHMGDLGHRASVRPEFTGERCDVLVALHAHRSYPSIARYRRERPEAPLVVALTGTDLYGDLKVSARARWSLEAASRLVLLQREGLRELPRRLRDKARVIYQSAQALQRPPAPREDVFEVCVLANLRAVKDPLRTAIAARQLPRSSRICIIHMGSVLEPGMERRAAAEMRRNPRYRWLGERPRAAALRILARCRLLVLSSLVEGGANVLSEAVAASVPIVASRIPGSQGLLGRNYPGYFRPGDTLALARLLTRAETDGRFYARLRRSCLKLAPQLAPSRERQAWRQLLQGLR